MQSSLRFVYSFIYIAWYEYFITEIYSNGVRTHGKLFWFTKNPANSIIGTTKTGVIMFITYGLLMIVERSKPRLPKER